MGNKVLNILTLVVAIAVVVGAYMLFEKRTLLLDRGDILAKELKATAKTLDQGSGTKVNDLIGDLDHKKVDDVKKVKGFASKVSKLSAQAKSVIEQRNALATALTSVASKLSIEGVDAANLENIAQTPQENEKVLSNVDLVVERDGIINAGIGKAAETAGVEVDTDTLMSLDVDEVETGMQTFGEGITALVEKNSEFKQHIGEISQILEIDDADIDDLDSNIENITQFKEDFDDTKSQLETAKTDLEEKEAELADAKTNIENLKSRMAEQEKAVVQLKDILNKSIEAIREKEEALAQVETTSDEYYDYLKLVRGKVIKINDKWGFAVINVGSKNAAGQSGLNLSADKAIPEGEMMDIARNVNGSNEYVAQFKVTKVYDDFTVGNIIAKDDSYKPEVGDEVYFSNATIDAMKEREQKIVEAKRKEIIKKAEAEKDKALKKVEVLEKKMKGSEDENLEGLDDLDEL